jgi:ASC-1-like (ASCH) protein
MAEYELFKIWPDHLKEMRMAGRKVIDIRVPDPDDDRKDYSRLKPWDILHFKDTNGEVLKMKVMRTKGGESYVNHYDSAEELLINEGIENVWPGVDDFDEAVEKCLQFPGYKERVEQKGIYAIGLEKLLIYVAGPYTATTDKGVEENVLKAVKTGIGISKLGYLAFVPHSALQGWEKLGLTENECIALENDYIRKSDAFYFIAPSKGTNAERKLALDLGLDIFATYKSLKYWKPANKNGNR